MKGIIFFLILICGLHSYGQRIKKSEVDKFTKSYSIETSLVTVSSGFTNGFQIGFRSVDTTIFLQVRGYGKTTGVLAPMTPIILLFSNENTVTGYSKELQSYNVGRYQNSYFHEYMIPKSSVEAIAKNKVVSIRVYANQEYTDTDIKDKGADNLSSVAKVFLDEFNKKENR